MAVRKSSRTLAVLLPLLASGAGLVPGGEAKTVNPDAYYPEGPLVDDGNLYYAEMTANRVTRWDGKENRVFWERPGCGPTSVARHPLGGFNILCHIGEYIVHVGRDGQTIGTTDEDAAGRHFQDPNASVNDRRGGVYFSSSGLFSPSAKSEGAVLYLDPEGSLHRMAEGIHYANGVAVSPDGTTLYVSEHLSRRILAYDIAGDGSLSGKRVFVALDDLVGEDRNRTWEIGPDGLAMDREGNLFAAEYGAGRVLVIDREGRLAATIPVPADDRYVTGIAFEAGEQRLFITAPGAERPAMRGAVLSVPHPLMKKD